MLKDSDSTYTKPNILYTAVLAMVVPRKSDKTMVILLISVMSSDSLLLSPVFQQEGSVSMNRCVYAVSFYYSEIGLSSNMEQ